MPKKAVYEEYIGASDNSQEKIDEAKEQLKEFSKKAAYDRAVEAQNRLKPAYEEAVTVENSAKEEYETTARLLEEARKA